MLADENWITVAGIRSTGVSASLGIGQYVVSLLKRMRQAPPALKRDRSPQPKNIKFSFLSVADSDDKTAGLCHHQESLSQTSCSHMKV